MHGCISMHEYYNCIAKMCCDDVIGHAGWGQGTLEVLNCIHVHFENYTGHAG